MALSGCAWHPGVSGHRPSSHIQICSQVRICRYVRNSYRIRTFRQVCQIYMGYADRHICHFVCHMS